MLEERLAKIDEEATMTAESTKRYYLFHSSKSGKSKSDKSKSDKSKSEKSGKAGKSKSGKSEASSYQHYGSFSLSYGTSGVTDVNDFQVPTFPAIDDLTTPTIAVNAGSTTPSAPNEDEGIVSSTTTKATATATAVPTPTVSTELGDDTIPTILPIDEFFPPTYGNLSADESTSLGGDTLQENKTTVEPSSSENEKGWNTTAGAVGITLSVLFLFSVAAGLKFSRRRRV